MTKTFDILSFAEKNRGAITQIARDFRSAGVTEACILATITIVASGKTFSRAAVVPGRAVAKPAAWLLSAARRLLKREFQPAGWVSYDEENDAGVALAERIPAPEPEQNVWQRADAAGKADLCDVLDGGSEALAKRLGVTRRRAQQILARELERARKAEQGELFAGVML
jgi:hypothetical protein